MRPRVAVAVAVAVAAAVAVAVAVAVAAALLAADFDCNGTYLIVKEGDTVWSLAERWCTGDIRAAADAIVAEYGTDIRPAQAVRLP
jgi:hypothetical protein